MSKDTKQLRAEFNSEWWHEVLGVEKPDKVNADRMFNWFTNRLNQAYKQGRKEGYQDGYDNGYDATGYGYEDIYGDK